MYMLHFVYIMYIKYITYIYTTNNNFTYTNIQKSKKHYLTLCEYVTHDKYYINYSIYRIILS